MILLEVPKLNLRRAKIDKTMLIRAAAASSTIPGPLPSTVHCKESEKNTQLDIYGELYLWVLDLRKELQTPTAARIPHSTRNDDATMPERRELPLEATALR